MLQERDQFEGSIVVYGVGSCECGNETSGSIKYGEFIE
jgi:hypothetical protein